MATVKVDVPEGILNFINKLVSQGQFGSIEEFVTTAIRSYSELYGYPEDTGGLKSALITILGGTESQVSESTSSSKKSGLTELEQEILDAFQGATYEFETALYGTYQMNCIRTGVPPTPKDDFIKVLEGLKSKGVLDKGESMGKVIWRVIG